MIRPNFRSSEEGDTDVPRRTVLGYGTMATYGLAMGVPAVQARFFQQEDDALDAVPVYMLDTDIYPNEPLEVVAGPLERKPTVTGARGFAIDLSNHDAFLVQYLDTVNEITVIFPHEDLDFDVGDELEIVSLTQGERRNVGGEFELKVDVNEFGEGNPPISPDMVAVVSPLPVSRYEG
ncbi:hypothetical protein [Haladaptatus sp. DFWS20]|uniref:hypothetical protein n=1 Tax=Haladaptatus sp. DFWS20 TaxID=3403467 RepID=UPI003EBF950B